MKRYKDYEWKFTSVLDEISKLNDRNSCLEIRLKDTETLFTKINELEIKLIELNNGMNYNAPVQIYYNYITVFTY